MKQQPWILALWFSASCVSDDEEHDAAAGEDTDDALAQRAQPELPRKLTAEELTMLRTRTTDADLPRITLAEQFGDDVAFYLAPGRELVLDAEVELSNVDDDGPSASDDLRAENDPLAACPSEYEESCLFPTGTYELVWRCDFPPLEPWTPYIGEPDLDRLAFEAPAPSQVLDWPTWPPANCYQTDVEVVHEIFCANSCWNCSVEVCTDLYSGQLWAHIPIRRPSEFVECTGRRYSSCHGGDDGDLPID